MSKVTDTFATELKDSGSRASYDTGAVRDNASGKGRLDLLPADAIIEVAKHFEKGAWKYSARNWEKGINYSRYIDSALRHTFQFLGGATDEPHLISAAWNLLCLIQTIKWVETGVLPTSLNDLPIRQGTVKFIDGSQLSPAEIQREYENAPTPREVSEQRFRELDVILADTNRSASREAMAQQQKLMADSPEIRAAQAMTCDHHACACGTGTASVSNPHGGSVDLTPAASAYLAAEGGTAIAANFPGPIYPPIVSNSWFEPLLPASQAFLWDKELYWYDEEGSVTTNVYGSGHGIRTTGWTPEDAKTMFDSGEWSGVEAHVLIVTRVFKTNSGENAFDSESALQVEFGFIDNKPVSHFIYPYEARKNRKGWTTQDYEIDPLYPEITGEV